MVSCVSEVEVVEMGVVRFMFPGLSVSLPSMKGEEEEEGEGGNERRDDYCDCGCV